MIGVLASVIDGVLVGAVYGLAAMGRASRVHVAARFAPHKDHVLDQMVAVYDELLASANGASGGAAHAPVGARGYRCRAVLGAG